MPANKRKLTFNGFTKTNIKDVEQWYVRHNYFIVQGGSNMTGTDLCVNKPHCAAAVRP